MMIDERASEINAEDIKLNQCPLCGGEGTLSKCATDPKTDKMHYWEVPCPECFGEDYNL